MSDAIQEAVLSIDFSLDRLDVALQAPPGAWVWPHRAFANNWPGYLALKQELLAYLEQHPSTRLTAVGESTGLYWWHTFQQLEQDPALAAYQPSLALLNAKHVKHFRKALSERDKSDMLDPQLIGLYYQLNGCDHPYRPQPGYQRLRFLTRAYCRLIHTLAAEKASCQSLVYLRASEYQRRPPFSDIFGVTSQQCLDEFQDIAAFADLPVDRLAEQLKTFSGNHLPSPQDNVQRLLEVAQNSFPVEAALQEVLYLVFKLSLQRIRFLEDQKQTLRRLIEQELGRFPEADLLLAELGFGSILVAGILSEIQDTRRFTTGLKFDRKRKKMRPRTYRDGQAAVAKLAGLWWPKRDSGRFQSQDHHLSRERNPYLRYWFVQSAYALLRFRKDYQAYYSRKYSEAHKHPHKRALMLTARKSVRLAFALLHKGQRLRLKEVVDH